MNSNVLTLKLVGACRHMPRSSANSPSTVFAGQAVNCYCLLVRFLPCLFRFKCVVPSTHACSLLFRPPLMLYDMCFYLLTPFPFSRGPSSRTCKPFIPCSLLVWQYMGYTKFISRHTRSEIHYHEGVVSSDVIPREALQEDRSAHPRAYSSPVFAE